VDADEIADMAIAVPGVVVSTNDVISIENALDSLFAVQNETNGLLPYAGRPFPPQAISFTYHLYTLIGVADHYLYTVSTLAALSLFGFRPYGGTKNKRDALGYKLQHLLIKLLGRRRIPEIPVGQVQIRPVFLAREH
jgi:hypothetical protein